MTGHRLEQRVEFRRADGAAVDVREHLDAARAQIADRPAGLRHRSVRIAERQRCHEAGEPLRVLVRDLRHAVVGGTGEIHGHVGWRKHLDGWRRDRKHLLVVAAEHVHDAEAPVEIHQHGHAPHPLADVLVVRGGLLEEREVARRQDVIEDVEFSHGMVTLSPQERRVASSYGPKTYDRAASAAPTSTPDPSGSTKRGLISSSTT